MKRTGAWLVRYALEQLNISLTFGIPGVHNTEIYDELNKSELISPILVTHEGGGAFMADAVSRTTGGVGALLIVPAAGITHAASGIGEAFLDGIPMMVISGGIKIDSDYKYQLHDIDQHSLLEPITKGTYKVEHQADILDIFYDAYNLATRGEPGPVFIEVPVDIQIDSGEIDELKVYTPPEPKNEIDAELTLKIKEAVELLSNSSKPGIFLGWGAVESHEQSVVIAELLGAPVSTTLQGLSAFPANHPLHTGMSFGPAAVPVAEETFKDCDCLLAVGTRFSEIATGSFSVNVPENLIHIDINPDVFNVNYKAKVAIQGDSSNVLGSLLNELKSAGIKPDRNHISREIADLKQTYVKEWLDHDSKGRVNVASFFGELRSYLEDDGIIVTDDGNHTFLTAELLPIHHPRGFVSPTDFNCMGYAVPAAIGAKLSNQDKQVVAIIGDGAFLMTCMELITAKSNNTGIIFIVFNDGKLAQISQAQEVPYNNSTCTELGSVNLKDIASATGVDYIELNSNESITSALDVAFSITKSNKPVLLDVSIDYSKHTRFTKGIVSANMGRLNLNTKLRMGGRAIWRRVISR